MSNNSIPRGEQRQDFEFLKDIQALVDNADHLSRIVDAHGLSAASVPRLVEKIAKTVALDESNIRAVLRALWRTKQYQQNNDFTPQQAIEKISYRLEETASDEWKTKHFESWETCKTQLAALLQAFNDDHPFLIAMKAQELAYTHQNILVGSRLITDIRPVFDSSGEHIRELVVTHTLSIRYSDANRESCLASFALDSEDVANLLHECQRAATKTKTIAEALSSFNPIVLPERTNEG